FFFIDELRARRGVDHASASLIALMGRARTALLAGFAANVIGSLVKGLMPWRALVAGRFTTRHLAKPGSVNTPDFFISRSPTVITASRTAFTCLRLSSSPIVSVIAWIRLLLLIVFLEPPPPAAAFFAVAMGISSEARCVRRLAARY